jgi:hypothetical protein
MELDDLAILVEFDRVAGEHITRLRNPLHLKDLDLDNPAVVIASDSGNPFRGAPDKLGEGIHRAPSELNTTLVVLRHVNHSDP